LHKINIDKVFAPPVKWNTEKLDTQYSFWTGGDNAFLAFQGSFSLTDWIFNLMFFPIYRKYYFHYGIYKKYEVLEDKIIKFINENYDKNIYFTGYSQGAGIALIAFILMKSKYPKINMKADLFGCPKILNLISVFSLHSLAQYINLYEIQTDIVTKIVPWNLRLGTIRKLGTKKPIWKWKIKDHYPSTYKEFYNGYI